MKEHLRQFTAYLNDKDWLAEYKGVKFTSVTMGLIRLKLVKLFDEFLTENPHIKFPDGARAQANFKLSPGLGKGAPLEVEVFMTVPVGLFNQKVTP